MPEVLSIEQLSAIVGALVASLTVVRGWQLFKRLVWGSL